MTLSFGTKRNAEAASLIPGPPSKKKKTAVDFLNRELFSIPPSRKNIQALLDRGAEVDARHPKYGYTLLQHLVLVYDLYGQDVAFEAIQCLVENGADLNAFDNWYGLTAFQRAFFCTPIKVLLYLLEKGADFTLPLRGEDIYAWLLARGEWSLIQWVLNEAPEKGNVTDPNGFTGLHWAVYHQDHQLLRKLLNHGGRHYVNVKNDMDRESALYLAVMNDDSAAIEMLCEYGANPNEYTESPYSEFNAYPLLFYAICAGKEAARSSLLKLGADASFLDGYIYFDEEKWKKEGVIPFSDPRLFSEKLSFYSKSLATKGFDSSLTNQVHRDLHCSYFQYRLTALGIEDERAGNDSLFQFFTGASFASLRGFGVAMRLESEKNRCFDFSFFSRFKKKAEQKPEYEIKTLEQLKYFVELNVIHFQGGMNGYQLFMFLSGAYVSHFSFSYPLIERVLDLDWVDLRAFTRHDFLLKLLDDKIEFIEKTEAEPTFIIKVIKKLDETLIDGHVFLKALSNRSVAEYVLDKLVKKKIGENAALYDSYRKNILGALNVESFFSTMIRAASFYEGEGKNHHICFDQPYFSLDRLCRTIENILFFFPNFEKRILGSGFKKFFWDRALTPDSDFRNKSIEDLPSNLLFIMEIFERLGLLEHYIQDYPNFLFRAITLNREKKNMGAVIPFLIHWYFSNRGEALLKLGNEQKNILIAELLSLDSSLLLDKCLKQVKGFAKFITAQHLYNVKHTADVGELTVRTELGIVLEQYGVKLPPLKQKSKINVLTFMHVPAGSIPADRSIGPALEVTQRPGAGKNT